MRVEQQSTGLSIDKESLVKLKSFLKEISKTGNSHVNSQIDFTKALHQIAESAITRENEHDEIGEAFQKFATVTKELASLQKNLMDNLDKIILSPVDRLLKSELQGSKCDLKRPFDKAWKDYQEKFSELERQKKKAVKDAGLQRTEQLASEIADEMEKECKYLQIATDDYLMKVNEIRTKKSVDLLQHFYEYYQAQHRYYNEGLHTFEHYGRYIEELMKRVTDKGQEKEDEKKELSHGRIMNKKTSEINKMGGGGGPSTYGLYTLHQAKGDAMVGNSKAGYLSKRSEGRLRNVWQRRYCQVRDGFLDIYHADESKQPTRVNLLTCQMKRVPEDRLCFDVVSYNRTYHFQAENESNCDEWMSVLLNSKDAALNQEFQNNGQANVNHCFLELQSSLVNTIRALPGNERCCDCDSINDATWLSTNFGIIVCIECSGIHREMGVHISKIQSLTLDNIGTSQLLVARFMSNEQFNNVMEACAKSKLNPHSTMDERKAYIRAKYEEKLFVQSISANREEMISKLEQSITRHTLHDLLQVFAEAHLHNVDLNDPLPENELSETSLHLAILHETGLSLHIVDFLVQNSSSLDKKTKDGNTALHYCVVQNQIESMRLLLRSGANTQLENNDGKTPLSLAKENDHELCEELLLHAVQQKKVMFENVNFDWHLSQIGGPTDFSDDENLDEPSTTPKIQGKLTQIYPNKLTRSCPHPRSTLSTEVHSVNNSNDNTTSKSSLILERSLIKGWSRPIQADCPSGESPCFMPPPPPPQFKKAVICSDLSFDFSGSLKKGSKPMSLITLPTTSQNILSSNHHSSSLRNSTPTTSSSSSAINLIHKRSSSTDSGIGSNTPLSSFHTNTNNGNQNHHTVYLQFTSKPNSSSETSPTAQPFVEESSPESRITLTPPMSGQILKGQSIESLDSFSDESGSHPFHVRQNSNTSKDSPENNLKNPVPTPRKSMSFNRLCLCQALYDCKADNEDELTFEEGDTIVIVNEETEDENWMEGHLLSDPSKRGLFPISFVHMISE